MANSLAQLGRSRHALLAAALALSAPLHPGAPAAAQSPCDAGPAEPVAVESVHGDGALALRDGRAVLLAGIVVPPGEWRERSVAELRRLVAPGEMARLGAVAPPDRHGRIAADISISGEAEPPAARLVARGLAWAYPPGRDACAALLLRREAEARRAGVGFWADAAFRPLAAAAPKRILEKRGEFVIVEGTVLSVGVRPKRTYLNFGAFWNQDFTAYMDTDAAAQIAPAGMAPGDLEGRRVRIRGYVLEERGPAIAVTQPGQLELVDTR